MVGASGQPAAHGGIDVIDGGSIQSRQCLAVGAGVTFVDCVLCEDVGLAAKPTDPFKPPNVSRTASRLDALQFVFGDAVRDESFDLLVDRCLDLREVSAGMCGYRGPEDATDLDAEHTRFCGCRNLIAINEALEQA